MNNGLVSTDELKFQIVELAEEAGVRVPDTTVVGAVRMIELIASTGLKCPIRVEPLPDGGIRVVIEVPDTLKLELDLHAEKKAAFRVFSLPSAKLLARFEGEIYL